MVRAIVGANWGDEGKGKITDLFAGQSDIVIRFQGGANAGHTIINEHGRFAFHLMPSGVCYDHTTCIIGNGVALDINKFCTELDDIKKAGLNPKLLVSERAQILMPYHILLDEYEEERLGKNAFGSTKSGIAPFFSDKYDLTKHPRYKYLTSFTKLALNTERRLLLTFAIHMHIFKTHLKRAKTFFLRVSSVHLRTLTSVFILW